MPKNTTTTNAAREAGQKTYTWKMYHGEKHASTFELRGNRDMAKRARRAIANNNPGFTLGRISTK